MTVLASIPDSAPNADVRTTLNDAFARIIALQGGNVPILAQIVVGSSYADVRATINDALARVRALEAGGGPAAPTPDNTRANSTAVRANRTNFSAPLQQLQSRLAKLGG